MQHLKSHAVVLLIAIAGLLVFVAAEAALPGHGQTQQDSALTVVAAEPTTTAGKVQPTAAVRERRTGIDNSDAAFGSAATRNLLLRDNLNWTFGGKQQRGWYLYVPLISRMLATDRDAATSNFAATLADWQKSAGLAPSGVLDEETLYQMVAAWQSVRIKDKSYPQPSQLLVAPASDFYDPERPEELRQVERETYAAYKRMIAAAAADPSLNLQLTKDGELAPTEKYLKIISAFRSREYQARLRQQSPNSGRAGLALNSPHFTGRALDIYVGGEPVETKDANRALQVQTHVYQWLVRNADRFGFRPYYYEPWHWEYVGSTSATESSKL